LLEPCQTGKPHTSRSAERSRRVDRLGPAAKAGETTATCEPSLDDAA